MISVEYRLGAADRHEVVAGVRDDLQPGFYIPAKRPERAVQVAPVPAAVVKSHKRVAAKKLHQRLFSGTWDGSLHARLCSFASGRVCGRLSRCRLRLWRRTRLRLNRSEEHTSELQSP